MRQRRHDRVDTALGQPQALVELGQAPVGPAVLEQRQQRDCAIDCRNKWRFIHCGHGLTVQTIEQTVAHCA